MGFWDLFFGPPVEEVATGFIAMDIEEMLGESVDPTPADGTLVLGHAPANGVPRPESFDEFVGNAAVVDLLRREIAGAARFTGGRIRNVLLYGSPGTGKTTLAKIIAKEQAYYLKSTTGNAIRRPLDMYKVLLELQMATQAGLGIGMLFIDEIHELCRGQGLGESELLPLFEDGIFHCPSIAGGIIEIEANNGLFAHEIQPVLVLDTPWVAVGATTEPGMLSDAMRRRFKCECFMRPYTEQDMRVIVERYSRTLGVEVTAGARYTLAERSRANPARAIALLETCRNRVAFENVRGADEALARREMEAQGIHDNGLTDVDLRILTSLRDCPLTKNGERMGLGLASIGDLLGMTPSTVAKLWEPFLKQLGFLVVASRRKITAKGLTFLTSL